MTNTPKTYTHDEANAIFAQLPPQDVEQFYASYQLWMLQQRVAEVQDQITTLAQHLADNSAHLQRVHPSAIALAALARLQSNGVNDIDLLDRMLERGEDWLDHTMQRLDYCEKLDFIRGNYTEWCEHALEGAYDWIDSVEETHAGDSSTQSPASPSDTDASTDTKNQTTEEMLLQKLMSDEDEAAMHAPTLKITAISPTKIQSDEETAQEAEEVMLSENDQLPTTPPSVAQAVASVQIEYIPVSGEGLVVEETPIMDEDQPQVWSESLAAMSRVSAQEETQPEAFQENDAQSIQSTQKRGLLRRLFAAFFSRQ